MENNVPTTEMTTDMDRFKKARRMILEAEDLIPARKGSLTKNYFRHTRLARAELDKRIDALRGLDEEEE